MFQNYLLQPKIIKIIYLKMRFFSFKPFTNKNVVNLSFMYYMSM